MRHSRRISSFALAGLTAAFALFGPRSVLADDTLWGARVGYYADAEKPFVGGEVLIGLGHSVWVNPNVEYVFTEGGKYATFNLDFHYDFPHRRRGASFYVGAGLGVSYRNPDGPGPSDTDPAANFLAGVAFSRGPIIPYFQAKLIAKDSTEAVIAFGLRF